MRSLAAFAITHTVISRVVGSPFGALVLLGALAAWPWIMVAAPLGIHPYSSALGEWNYELAFMAGMLGVVLATAARKRLDPLLEVSAGRPTALADAGIVAVCGLLFAFVALLPVFLLGPSRATEFGLARALPLLMVAAAGSALAMRLFPGVEATAWSVGVVTVLLPTFFPTTHLFFRATAAAAALVLGAALVDHPPARHR